MVLSIPTDREHKKSTV